MITRTSKEFIKQANDNVFICKDLLRIQNKKKIIYISFKEINDYYNLTRYKHYVFIRKIFMMPEDVLIKMNIDFIKSKGVNISLVDPSKINNNWEFNIINNELLNVYSLDWIEYIKLSKIIRTIRMPLWKYKGFFIICSIAFLLLAFSLILGFWHI